MPILAWEGKTVRLKTGFVSREMAGTHVIVGTEETNFQGMIRANATAGFIIGLLSEEITQEKIVAEMLEKYDAPRAVIEQSVQSVLDKLRDIGAIQE